MQQHSHEPIIPKDVFYQVQGEMQRRSALKYDPSRIRYGSTQALHGRLICGHCGRALKRYLNPNPAMNDWRCRQRAYQKLSITKENTGACPCRNVPEKEVKAAIITAFNQLPGVRDELIRMQGAVWNGEIRRIDATLENMKEQQTRLSERLDALSIEQEAGESDEARFLREEVQRMEEERTTLILDRAEAANTEVQIRLLLELVDAMREQRSEAQERYDSPACYDYDEFFRRTRYVVDEGVIGDDGRIMAFQNDMVIRYLNNVTVLDDGYDVNFKCGLTVKVNLKK